ncbi:MAG: PD40 domain-containing protein [Candidatus Delongbacteria bacterium]|nr:PD40 domain-containing protein [Candidatus Delongbacteria bacterium]
MKKTIYTYILLISSVFTMLSAQILDMHNHPELQWRTFDTEHFIFHYHQGTEKSAVRFASVGESIYGTITKLYNFYPDYKIHVIINDYDDMANGGAYYYNDKISLWAPAFDTILRGDHFWYTNLFAHEFSHMIQLQVPRKASKMFPGLYLQWTGYEDEKREDVLTGFPNILSSANIPMNIIPPWFAEGVAQNQDPDTLHYDFWDANRDMLLRERILEGKELKYSQLTDFYNRSSHEAESIYNTGFAFVKYIFEKYGKDVPYKISEEMGKAFSFSFEEAIKRVTGKRGDELYSEWINDLREKYRQEIKNVENNLVQGKDISDSAFVNSNPKFSPDGKYLAFLSTKIGGEPSFYKRDLHIKDLKTDSIKFKIPAVMFSSYSWTPDSRSIYFSRSDKHSIYGNNYLDIYHYDIKEDEEEQITHGMRAANPEVSPDGKKIAFVATHDGTRNLYIYDIEKDVALNLTKKDDGTQYFLPKWSKDGSKILIDRSIIEYGKDIVEVDTLGNVTTLISTKYDDRDPVYSPDEKYVYYASDRTGIYNIYRRDIASGLDETVTNVRGGAFYPELQQDTLVYVNYNGIRTNIYEIKDIEPIETSKCEYRDYEVYDNNFLSITTLDYLKDSRRYMNDFQSIMIVPRLAFDNNNFKPGIYFFLSDYLDKVSLFGGYNRGMNGDSDLFAMTEFKFLLPTIYGMAFNMVRTDDNTFINDRVIVHVDSLEDGTDIPEYEINDIDFTYDIMELDFGIKVPFTLKPKIFKYPLGELDMEAFFTYVRSDAAADYGDFVLKYTYFKEKSYNVKLNLASNKFRFNHYINRTYGRDVTFTYSRHITDFITGFSLNSDYGTLQEDYRKYNYNQYDLDIKEYFKLPLESGLTLKMKFSYLDDENIDSFYYNYIGGLTGLQGYSFYSLGGTKTAYASTMIRFPIVKRTDKLLGIYNFKNLYAGILFGAGTGWTDEAIKDSMKDLKKSVGLNIRMFGTIFYGFPLSVDYTVAYGLDKFVNEDVTYGHEVRSYLTVLFDFIDF